MLYPVQRMIHVRLYSLLAERSLSGRDSYETLFRAGLRPIDLIHAEGFFGDEAEAIVVIVNDEHAAPDTPLRDGDHVELMIGMVGG